MAYTHNLETEHRTGDARLRVIEAIVICELEFGCREEIWQRVFIELSTVARAPCIPLI